MVHVTSWREEQQINNRIAAQDVEKRNKNNTKEIRSEATNTDNRLSTTNNELKPSERTWILSK